MSKVVKKEKHDAHATELHRRRLRELCLYESAFFSSIRKSKCCKYCRIFELPKCLSLQASLPKPSTQFTRSLLLLFPPALGRERRTKAEVPSYVPHPTPTSSAIADNTFFQGRSLTRREGGRPQAIETGPLLPLLLPRRRSTRSRRRSTCEGGEKTVSHTLSRQLPNKKIRSFPEKTSFSCEIIETSNCILKCFN